MVLLSEGGEPKLGSNINYLLEQHGIVVNTDSVVSSTYCGYMHPKEALVTHGILNREIAREAGKASPAIKFVYPFGATLDVQKPAVPIISTGKNCFPMQRPVAAVVNCGVCPRFFCNSPSPDYAFFASQKAAASLSLGATSALKMRMSERRTTRSSPASSSDTSSNQHLS
jgi:hypothetical protein